MRHNEMVDINYVTRKIQLTSSKIMPYKKADEPADQAIAEQNRKSNVSSLQD